MPPASQDRRNDVIETAKARGWTIDSDTTTHGALSDQFIKSGVTLTCFWGQTPWSDARWHGGFAASPDGPRQVWKIEGGGGVMSILNR